MSRLKEKGNNTMEENKKNMPLAFCVYRPNNKNTGSALQIKLSTDKSCLFLETTGEQIKNEKKFNWENKIVIKLEIPDISKIMAILTKRTKECKLYHQTEKANKSLSIVSQEGAYSGFYMKIGQKLTGKEEVINVGIPLDDGDAECLLALLRGIIPTLYRWI